MSLNDVQQIYFSQKAQADSFLVVYQEHIPFDMKRVFYIYAKTPTTRGQHAHRQCHQLLIALAGRCQVECDDGQQKQNFLLENPAHGLLIPAGIWAKQHYLDPETRLMVLCSEAYDERDYIRDYQAFLHFAKSPLSST